MLVVLWILAAASVTAVAALVFRGAAAGDSRYGRAPR